MKMKMRKIATKISKGHANRNANTKAAGQDKLLHVNRIPRGLRGLWSESMKGFGISFRLNWMAALKYICWNKVKVSFTMYF